MFEVEILGEISSPVFVTADNYQEKSTVQGDLSDEMFRVEGVDYIPKKGVWKPLITLTCMNEPEVTDNPREECAPWYLIKEDIDETFLPGYTFTWRGYGPKPLDWMPPGFAKIFDQI